jgi:hypothetical protein
MFLAFNLSFVVGNLACYDFFYYFGYFLDIFSNLLVTLLAAKSYSCKSFKELAQVSLRFICFFVEAAKSFSGT